MTNKYPGIDNINKPAFDAIVPKVEEAMNNGKISFQKGNIDAMLGVDTSNKIVKQFLDLPTTVSIHYAAKEGATITEGCLTSCDIILYSLIPITRPQQISYVAFPGLYCQSCIMGTISPSTGIARIIAISTDATGGPANKKLYIKAYNLSGELVNFTLDKMNNYNITIS